MTNKSLGAIIFLTACSTMAVFSKAEVTDAKDLVNKEYVYTLTNLHPDDNRKLLYTVNYQQPGLIPVCTEVQVQKVSRKKMTFVVKGSEMEYTYAYHKSAVEGFSANVLKYFGEKCPDKEIKRLSKTDKDGVKNGVVTVGMTKEGVIRAIGYPPEHETPSTDMDRWTYWFNRFNRFIVVFDEKGVVKEVIN